METNYETQQSPLYYWLSGLAIRPIRKASPTLTLYVLRLANAFLAFAAVLVTANVAKHLFAERDWFPIAYAALIPGLGIAFARVCNDALAAFLISLAIAGTLALPTFGAAAAGLAPWAKLYGGAAVPGALLPIPGERRLVWGLRALTISGCVVLLLFVSARIHGHIFPIQENLRVRSSVSLTEVSWVRNLWTIAKSHIFVSGMSVRVFPKWIYLVAIAIILAAVGTTIRAVRRCDVRAITALVLPLFLFFAALLYHSWRNYSFFGGGGGTGGWYLWAMLLPESMLISWGAARGGVSNRFIGAALYFFLALTIWGDLILISDGSVSVSSTPTGPVANLLRARAHAFLISRPLPVAFGALATALASWVLAGIAIRQTLRNQSPSV